jgi:DnaJ-class molecular chaperone
MSIDQTKFSNWLNEQFPSSYGSAVGTTKEALNQLFALATQQQHLELAFVEEKKRQEEIRKLKSSISFLENKLEDSIKLINRATKFGQISVCPQCNGEGGFEWGNSETGETGGEECGKCKSFGFLNLTKNK